MKLRGKKPQPSEKETTAMQFGEVRKRFGHLLNEIEYGGRRIVIDRRGHESVAIISVKDFRAFEAFEQQAKPASDVFETDPLPTA